MSIITTSAGTEYVVSRSGRYALRDYRVCGAGKEWQEVYALLQKIETPAH